MSALGRKRRRRSPARRRRSAARGRKEQRARATVAQRQRELTRIRELAGSRVVSAQELDTQQAEWNVANESLSAAVFAVQAATFELQRAEARLLPPAPAAGGRVVTIVSPASGVVLKLVRESESVVPAGDPLVEIGDPTRLEIVADLLSTDAVRVKPGSAALIEHWGGETTLDAIVRRVEPAGFTKVSALGIEEQRVNVIFDFADPACATMGDQYRVEVRTVIWEAREVLKIPTSALFRDGEHWAVYRVAGDRARRTRVEVGHQTGQEAEIVAGLSAGDTVVIHPGETLQDGARVKVR